MHVRTALLAVGLREVLNISEPFRFLGGLHLGLHLRLLLRLEIEVLEHVFHLAHVLNLAGQSADLIIHHTHLPLDICSILKLNSTLGASTLRLRHVVEEAVSVVNLGLLIGLI